MATEPTIIFLDLACAIGTDLAHNRTIQNNLGQLYRDALSGALSPGRVGWNAHSNTKRLGTDEYPLKSVRPDDGRLDLLPEFLPITRKEIVEMLAERKCAEADRALDLLEAGAESDAYRLVAEAPLSDEGTTARLFVESLAVTVSEAWRFCERNCLSVPDLLRQLLAAWLDGVYQAPFTATTFTPKGRISIPDAVTEIVEALHPGDMERAAVELRQHRSGELPDSYYRYCKHKTEAENKLLRTMRDGDLSAWVSVSGADWKVPAHYWETDGAGMTLSFGALYTRHTLSADWRERHEQPCFIEEEAFRRWLAANCRPAALAATSRAVGAKAFEGMYWNYIIVLAWVYFREHALVERVADSAVNGRPFAQEETLPDGRKLLVETDAGPMTPLSLTLLANQRRENPATAPTAPKVTCSEAGEEIRTELRAGTLTAYGLENDSGDLRPIPALWWADGKVYEGRDSRPFAGPEDIFRTGATRWHGLLFERKQVLSLWPDPMAADTDRPAELRINTADSQQCSDSDLTDANERRSAQSNHRRRGRRPSYDWTAFHAEIAKRVGSDPDGFPVVQADLERGMADWCLNTWGEDNCPSESTVREQVARYYRQTGEADKST